MSPPPPPEDLLQKILKILSQLIDMTSLLKTLKCQIVSLRFRGQT